MIFRGLDTRLDLWSDSSQSLKIESEYGLHEAEGWSQHRVLAKIFVSDTFIYSCTLDCVNYNLEKNKLHFKSLNNDPWYLNKVLFQSYSLKILKSYNRNQCWLRLAYDFRRLHYPTPELSGPILSTVFKYLVCLFVGSSPWFPLDVWFLIPPFIVFLTIANHLWILVTKKHLLISWDQSWENLQAPQARLQNNQRFSRNMKAK